MNVDRELVPVIGAREIDRRVGQLAGRINADYAGGALLLVCVLKGAFMFCADLARRLSVEAEIDFVRVKSYGAGDVSSGRAVLVKDVECGIAGRDVLIVEDIVDTGISMNFLLNEFAGRRPGSLRLAALIDKKERRQVQVSVDYPCFTIDQGFMVGYGLDYAERYRTSPGIFSLKID
ncbi:MAG: hypoxanthine phosphoribosyltransferase [Desulfovibrio sp.]|jgi:hypoxanthine phosphoribosyltransferase|nr:hypoxanthine phosphoribosyltransferase [Desulfovibrio sp.]